MVVGEGNRLWPNGGFDELEGGVQAVCRWSDGGVTSVQRRREGGVKVA